MSEKPMNEESEKGLHQIPERDRDEGELRESEERYRTILESIEEAYFEVDLRGNFTFFNDSLPVILGYSRDELKGMSYRDYMPPEVAKEILGLFNQIYRTEKPVRKHGYEVIKKDGSRGFHELFASLRRDGDGKPNGFRGISHDITDRKLAEDEREKLIIELQNALAQVKTLSGLLPICSHCKKVRDDKGYWNKIESYVRDHSKAEFSHSICPECAKKYFSDYNLYRE